MAFYSDELKEEVRSRNDIVDVISGYVSLKKKGSVYFGLCPFHNEKTPSFSVTRSKQIYYCYGCGAGGDVISFIRQYENLSFPEAMQVLADRAGITLPQQEMTAEQRAKADRRQKMLDANKEAAKYYYSLLKGRRGERALAYFRDRGLSDETITRFGLGFSDIYSDDLYRYLKGKGFSDDVLKRSGLVTIDEKHGGRDKFWNRAMFPIMDPNNKVIGFGGRVMGDGEPKYLNSPESEIFEKRKNLYGLNFAKSSRRRGMLLCEGYMDVISLHQAGFDNAVASLGTSFTDGHAAKLKRYTREVFLTFDSDQAGRRAALRAIPILKDAGISARVVDMTPHKDPDEFIKALGAGEYEKRLESAENSFMFEIRMMQEDYDLSDPTEKSEFFRAAAKKILEFPQELERDNYIQAVAARYNTGVGQLREMVKAAAASGGIAVSRQPLKTTRKNASDRKEEGIRQTQKLFITWLSKDPNLFEMTEGIIGPEDFQGEPYAQTVSMLYEQHKKGKPDIAAIIGHFEDDDQQRIAASMFHAALPDTGSEPDKVKALRDVVMKIKKNSLDERAAALDPADIEGLQRLIEDKKALSKINTLG